MEEKTLTVPAISCAHCVANIQRELGELEGVRSVSGDATEKKIIVRWEPPATWQSIRDLLEEIGYPPA